jgi:chemotaxis protein MotB
MASRRRGRVRRLGGGGGAGGKQENYDRWLITYADLITLLMIFFVVLYAMSKVDESKFETLSVSLSQALQPDARIPLDNSGLLEKSLPKDATAKEKQKAEQQKLDELKKRLEQYIADQKLNGQVNVLETERGVQITLSDAALFDSGSADVREPAVRLLNGLAPFLKLVSNEVAIEGHTDNVPIHSDSFRSNWELSSARAINVLHVFEGAGVQHGRMVAEGYADTKPLVQNDSEKNQASNRRVNLVVLRQNQPPELSPFQGQ